MATATMPRVGDEIVLDYGAPQILAMKFCTGKNLGNSRYPPYQPRVLFTAVDSRKLFLDAEDGSEFEHALQDLGIRPGTDFIRVTKVKHPRGGGHSIRVERIEDEYVSDEDGGDRKLIAQLEKSIDMNRERKPAASAPSWQRNAPAQVPPAVSATNGRSNGNISQVPPSSPARELPPAAAAMCSAMCAAVDAILETQAYATRRGLGVTFSEESVRAIGLSIYIGNQRGGGR